MSDQDFYWGAGIGIVSAFLGEWAFDNYNAHRHIQLDVPKDLEALVRQKSPIVQAVDENVCGSLSKQWESYAKKHGLVNADGEPVVTLHCEVRNNPAPAPQNN